MMIYFMVIWKILWTFGIFMTIWYILSGLGVVYQEKSGNPDYDLSLASSYMRIFRKMPCQKHDQQGLGRALNFGLGLFWAWGA
jgi:hypothetical protein